MSRVKQQEKPRPWRVHPIWRGIGCVMLVLLPIVAYAGSDMLVDNVEYVQKQFNQMGFFRREVYLLAWFDVVRDYVPQVIPQMDSLENTLALSPIPYFWGKMLLAFVITMILFAFLSILYSIVFSVMGPSAYGQLDVKPQHYTRKKTKIKKIKY
jgi:hypothetical protein